MKFNDSVCGAFGEEFNLPEFDMITMNRALEQNLQQKYACFITFHGNTFVVIAQDGMYYIFDSHSRDKRRYNTCHLEL